MICFRDKFIDKRELLVTEMERAAHTLEVEDAEDFGVGEWRWKQSCHSCIEGRDDAHVMSGVCARYQRSVWDLMEKPESSRAAKVRL